MTEQEYLAERLEKLFEAVRGAGLGEAVVAAVIRKARLHPQMRVAVAGPGAGELAEGMAGRAAQVLVLEGQDGQAGNGTPERYDTLIANLYPFSETDPLEAVRELAHRIKPGGRLVLTGAEAQMGTEGEVPGFMRGGLETLLAQAGLVNRIVERIEIAGQGDPSGRQPSLPGLFVAVGARRLAGVEEAVRENYAALAQGGGSCCTPAADNASCCGGETLISLDSIGEAPVQMEQIYTTDYSPADREAIPSQAAEFSLGCGNPTAFAALQPGEVVLDIGSGGGLDALIAARQVGPQGKVIGVDMTPEMLERARRAAAAAGFGHVEFRQGQADALPVESGSVDVILSNCVINLTPDKGQVFQEAWRVLRPGGRLEVSDVVTDIAFLPDLLAAGQAWSSCVTGALPEEEYVDLIRQAGFSQVTVRRSQAAITGGVKVYSAQVSGRKTTS
jgi:arsenite methyltransferase